MGDIPSRLLDKVEEYLEIEAEAMREAKRRVDRGEFTIEEWNKAFIKKVEESNLPKESKQKIKGAMMIVEG